VNATLTDIRRRILTYLILTFGFSAVFYYLIIGSGSVRAAGGLYTLALMWCPGAAAIATSLLYRHSLAGLGWRLGDWTYLRLGYVLPLAYSAVIYAFVWLTRLGGVSQVALRDAAMQFGLPATSPAAAAISYFLTTATFTLLLGGVPGALGEELGWRGFLVPELARVMSFTRTSLISGAVWLVYHIPLILFADYNSGTPAWFALPAFGIGIIGLSFAFTWLRLRSESVWPAVLLHASHNTFIQAFFDPLTADTGVTRYFTGEFGVGIAVAGVVIGLLFWRRRASAEPPEPTDRFPVSSEFPT
jgi:membrane protease YdiL (CAAX protease family)